MTKIINKPLLEEFKILLHSAQQAVNTTMVQTYWHIGRLIVEDEQNGKERAAYGKKQLEQVADTLTQEFGKGFDARNLRNMRQFYLAFPIWNAVRTELSWTHYRRLISQVGRVSVSVTRQVFYTLNYAI